MGAKEEIRVLIARSHGHTGITPQIVKRDLEILEGLLDQYKKEILRESLYEPPPPIREILLQVSQEYRIPVKEITGRSRNGTITRARTAFIKYAHQMGHHPDAIGQELGRDRSTIYAYLDKSWI